MGAVSIYFSLKLIAFLVFVGVLVLLGLTYIVLIIIENAKHKRKRKK